MNIFANLDLLALGIIVAATIILGTLIFNKNRNSITSKAFLAFAAMTIAYAVANYLSYHVSDPQLALWFLRLTIFFAVLHTLSIFNLFYVFPQENFSFSKLYKFLLIPIVGVVSLLTLTPFVLSKIAEFGQDGRITKVANGPGIIPFGIVIVFLVASSLVLLIKKTIRAKNHEKTQLICVTVGALLTFSLIIIFNFIFPALLENSTFVPLAPIFFLPFISLTAYAIMRHGFLHIKIISAEILTFVLAIVTLLEVIFAHDLSTMLLRSGIFILLLSFGTLLIKSVHSEIEQREKLEILTKQLGSANEKLKELDKQKDQFLSFASHDLKSPINIIKQFATLIADGTYKEPAKVAETIQKIKTTADRATHLVDDFLDIRKIEEGHMDYAFETKDIVPFVRGVVEDYAPLAKAQKNIAVSFETKIASVNVKIDTTRFRQVIQNLLSNSLKYTESGSIKVKIAEEQRSVLISVQDSGIGMDTALLPVLFEQFRRDPGVAKKIQGTGLGLYISKQIVLGHGGEIWASSEGKGHGSTFYVRMKKI